MQMYGMSGEPLGVIGTSQPSSDKPEWKQYFLSKPSASIRKGIAWGFDAPYEDTDTLVLTARSGRFVDVRLPKDSKSVEETLGHSSYWAFSGEAITTFYDSSTDKHVVGLPYAAHCVWKQDIDSRGPGIVDEGDMFILPDGDCVEIGTMDHPTTGKNTLYKEYWGSAAPLSTPNTPDDSGSTTVAVGVNRSGHRGFMIRVGGRIQGLLQGPPQGSDKHVFSLRMERVTGNDGSTSWKRDHRTLATVPWEWLADPNRQLSDKITQTGLDWEIIESHQG